MTGSRIVEVRLNRPNLRFPFPTEFSSILEGKTVLHVGRRAKYLVCDISNGKSLIMHLGMSGSFRIEFASDVDAPGVFHHPRSDAQKHDHVIIHLATKWGRQKSPTMTLGGSDLWILQIP